MSTDVTLGSKMLTRNDCALFFRNDTLLVNKTENSFIIPFSAVYEDPGINLCEQDYFFLGKFKGENIFAVAFNPASTEKSFSFIPTRDALKVADSRTSQFICRGKQLLYWHRFSLYSGCCGSSTKLSKTEIAKICQNCDKVMYPTTFPVIIVLIEKGEHILLARSPHFVKGMYSILAGFVDAGESCEEAIHREIAEEVGIKVKNISYFGSQSWPFPNSLMLGYRAQYTSGEITIDEKEIEDAQWFKVSDLPLIPHGCSIARQMIDHYIDKVKV